MDLEISLVTPSKPVFEGFAKSVIIPLYDGLAGILKNHINMIAQLGAGKLTIYSGEEKLCYFVSGGFIEVSKNKIVILANEACSKEELNYEEVEKEYKQILTIKPKTIEEIEEKNYKLYAARKKLSFVKS